MKQLFVPLARLVGTAILLAALLPAGGLVGQADAARPGPPLKAESAQARIQEAAQSGPLMFIENDGQFDPRARFVVQGGNSSIFLAEDAFWYSLSERPKGEEGQGSGVKDQVIGPDDQVAADRGLKGVNLKLSFVGANPHPRIEPFERLETRVSYFIGNDPSRWKADVPVWGGVRYVDIYPGLDLEITSENGEVVQTMVTKNEADLEAVRLKVEGADSLEAKEARVQVKTAIGTFTVPRVEVQNADGSSAAQVANGPEVNGNVVIHPFSASQPNSDLVAFGASDLLYSTYLGGTAGDDGYGIAVDSTGAAYVTGYTSSPDFPTTPGSVDTTYNDGSMDAFVTKLNPSGSQLVYSTFLGGTARDDGYGIAVDGSGAAYITGGTGSSDFPTTPGSAYTTYNGGYADVFVTKLNPNGSQLVYSTYLGGSGYDSSTGIAVVSSGAAYVTGVTASSDFPTTPDAFDTTNYIPDYEAFVTKLNPSGAQLDYSTYLGGNDYDRGMGVAVDGSGAAYVTGYTVSSDFPTTPGAFDPTFNGGGSDAFVTKLNPGGSQLVYSTYLGGSAPGAPDARDDGYGLAVDSTGAVYVIGETQSPNFPTTPGTFDTTYNGGYSDAFATKLNPSGSQLVYSTFLGGSDFDGATGIAVVSSGAAYVTGQTASSDFPTTAGAFDTTNTAGHLEAFVTKLNPSGSQLVHSTYLGGSAHDHSNGIAVDSSGAAYVTGGTESSDFPTTPGAFDTTLIPDDSDAFVTKLAMLDYKVVNLPVILDSAYGGWNTGISIRNPLPSPTSVQIRYYNDTGTNVLTDTQTVAANGYWGVYQGGQFGGNWAGSATILSTKPVTAIVNEVGPDNYAMGYTGAITSATTIYLPAVMDNAYGGWTSGIGIKNTSNIAAAVTIRYYRPDGVQADSESQTIQPNGYWGVYQGGKFGEGWAGSAVITSNQPVVAVVNEVHSSGSAISYNGFPAGGNLVNLPAVLNNAYGGWTTGVSIQNTSTNSASGSITYYNANGTPAGQQSINLSPKGSAGLYQGTAGLPDDWAGSAVISTTTAVVAVVNEVPTSGDAMGYGGVLTGAVKVDLPAVMDNAYGGWNTGLGIQNTSGSAVHVDITFYDAGGTNIAVADQTIPGHGYWGLYQGGALGGRAGSAKIVSSGPVAMVVNEVGPGGSAISYNGTP